MKYNDIEKIEKGINKDIDDLKEWDIEDVDEFVNTNYQQFLVNGEPSDNTMETSYHFRMIKEIQEDKAFMGKLRFVLNKYW